MRQYSTTEKILILLGLTAAIFLFGVVFSYTAHAGEIYLKWNPNPEPDIECYRVYEGTQVDMNTWTWEQVGEVLAPTTEFIYDIPDELRLFRVSAIDTAGQEGLKYSTGIFSCPNWVPPTNPCGVRTE